MVRYVRTQTKAGRLLSLYSECMRKETAEEALLKKCLTLEWAVTTSVVRSAIRLYYIKSLSSVQRKKGTKKRTKKSRKKSKNDKNEPGVYIKFQHRGGDKNASTGDYQNEKDLSSLDIQNSSLSSLLLNSRIQQLIQAIEKHSSMDRMGDARRIVEEAMEEIGITEQALEGVPPRVIADFENLLMSLRFNELDLLIETTAALKDTPWPSDLYRVIYPSARHLSKTSVISRTSSSAGYHFGREKAGFKEAKRVGQSDGLGQSNGSEQPNGFEQLSIGAERGINAGLNIDAELNLEHLQDVIAFIKIVEAEERVGLFKEYVSDIRKNLERSYNEHQMLIVDFVLRMAKENPDTCTTTVYNLIKSASDSNTLSTLLQCADALRSTGKNGEALGAASILNLVENIAVFQDDPVIIASVHLRRKLIDIN